MKPRLTRYALRRSNFKLFSNYVLRSRLITARKARASIGGDGKEKGIA